MSVQALFSADFLSCSICCEKFALIHRLPISLKCGHTVCSICLNTLQNKPCPFDQISTQTALKHLPMNYAILQLICKNKNVQKASHYIDKLVTKSEIEIEHLPSVQSLSPNDLKCYKHAKKSIEGLALYLKKFLYNGRFGNLLSRQMHRKLVTLFNCQLLEDEGKTRALRTACSLGERTVTEFILQRQNSQQASSNLWAVIRLRGCQFLGPEIQERVLKLILLALEDGSALSRKVLVMFIVQRLQIHFPQASKTSVGHVIQLLYRASCFNVLKREKNSSLMQLKVDLRTYKLLRRQHDAQIVQIAIESGVRIAPELWSLLLYGDNLHKSHMQSVIDKLQAFKSFNQSIQELTIALQRSEDVSSVSSLRDYLKHLSCIDLKRENSKSVWPKLANTLDAVKQIVIALIQLTTNSKNQIYHKI